MSRIVGGSASGLQMSSNSTLDILNGGRKVGSIALKEKRLMDLATLAGRAVTLPGMVALGATVLLQYGLEKCADGSWCTPGQGQQAPNGVPYPASEYAGVGLSTGVTVFGDAATVCNAVIEDANTHGIGVRTSYGGIATYSSTYGCKRVRSDNGVTFETPLQRYTQGTCFQPGSTKDVSSGMCIPPGYTPGTQPAPATPAQVNTAWQNAMKANPYLQQQTWGFEDQTQQNEDWAKAIAQLAEVIGTGTVQDVQPEIASTAADGKVTKKQTTCTYTGTANSNMATAGESPLNVSQKCVTTTTNPDGTKTTETTETATAPAQGRTPEKVDIETCGLPGKPACKIDETSTPQAQKAETVAETSQAIDNVLKQQTTALDNVLKGEKPQTNWFSWLPQIPRAECKPMAVELLGTSVTVDWCPAVVYMQTLATVIWVFTIMGGCIAEVKDALNGA